MKHEKPWLTCKDISMLLGCTQRNVLNILERKKISTEKDDSGKHIIQKSEFFRVFPHLMGMEESRREEKPVRNEVLRIMEEKLKHTQELLDEKKKLNEFLIEQISANHEKESKMLDALGSFGRLLEHKEKGDKETRKGFNWWPFKKK